MKKGLQRQKGAVTLVSSQKQRVLLVPVINRLSTARRSLCSSNDLHRISLVRAREEMFRRFVFDALEGKRTIMSCANKPVGVPSFRDSCAQLLRRAPPDSTHSWCVRVLDSTGIGEKW